MTWGRKSPPTAYNATPNSPFPNPVGFLSSATSGSSYPGISIAEWPAQTLQTIRECTFCGSTNLTGETCDACGAALLEQEDAPDPLEVSRALGDRLSAESFRKGLEQLGSAAYRATSPIVVSPAVADAVKKLAGGK